MWHPKCVYFKALGISIRETLRVSYTREKRLIWSLHNEQRPTAQLDQVFPRLYSFTMEDIWSALPVCFNIFLSNDTYSLKRVLHLLGIPGYVISFLWAVTHKQDMPSTGVKASRSQPLLPKCTWKELFLPLTIVSFTCELSQISQLFSPAQLSFKMRGN